MGAVGSDEQVTLVRAPVGEPQPESTPGPRCGVAQGVPPPHGVAGQRVEKHVAQGGAVHFGPVHRCVVGGVVADQQRARVVEKAQVLALGPRDPRELRTQAGLVQGPLRGLGVQVERAALGSGGP